MNIELSKGITFAKISDCHRLDSFDEKLAIQFYRFDMEMLSYDNDRDIKHLILGREILGIIHEMEVKMYQNRDKVKVREAI